MTEAATAADAPVQPTLTLCDMLPLDVIQHSIWEPLLPQDACTDPRDENDKREAWDGALSDCWSFKLTCKSIAQLVDELTATVSYTAWGKDPVEDATGGVWLEDGDELVELVPMQNSFRQDGTLRAAFHARLPRLTTVRIEGWRQEADLISELQQCTAATSGRVTRLALISSGTVSVASMAAVRLACPNLRQLYMHLLVDSVPMQPLPNLHSLFMQQDAPQSFFQPLHDVRLTKLFLFDNNNKADEALLRSLGGLTALQHLEVLVHSPVGRHLRHLAPLSQLTHCDLFLHPGNFTLPDIAPLLSSATQLHTLFLGGLQYDSLGSAAPSSVGAALALLGDLRCLHSLDLCNVSVDDLAFAALRRLSQLTSLECRNIRLTEPSPGHLPLLRRLVVAYMQHVRPSSILQSLLPLLPLPSLVDLNTGHPWPDPSSCSLQLHMSHNGGCDTAAELVALRCVAHYLAAAPLLRLGREVEFGSCHATTELTSVQIEDGLQLLLARFPGFVVKHVDLRYCTCHSRY